MAIWRDKKTKGHPMDDLTIFWRRGGDSNSRGELLPPNDLANRPLQPLGYLSLLVLGDDSDDYTRWADVLTGAS